MAWFIIFDTQIGVPGEGLLFGVYYLGENFEIEIGQRGPPQQPPKFAASTG